MKKLDQIKPEELQEIKDYPLFKEWLEGKKKMERPLYVFKYTRDYKATNVQLYFTELD